MPSDEDPATAQSHGNGCTEELSHYKRPSMYQYKNPPTTDSSQRYNATDKTAQEGLVCTKMSDRHSRHARA